MKLEDVKDQIDAGIEKFFSRPDANKIIEREYIYEHWKKDNEDYLKRFYYEKLIEELSDIIEASHRTDTFDFVGALQSKKDHAKFVLKVVEDHIQYMLKENGITCF